MQIGKMPRAVPRRRFHNDVSPTPSTLDAESAGRTRKKAPLPERKQGRSDRCRPNASVADTRRAASHQHIRMRVRRRPCGSLRAASLRAALPDTSPTIAASAPYDRAWPVSAASASSGGDDAHHLTSLPPAAHRSRAAIARALRRGFTGMASSAYRDVGAGRRQLVKR